MRWDAFVGYLAGCKQNGTVYNGTEVVNVMGAIGKAWDAQSGGATGTSAGQTGDTLDVVRVLAAKYGA